MFQIKNFTSITAAALNYIRSATKKITDLQPGSVSRTLVEASAAEVEELYIQMFNGLLEAIPVAIYRSFDFSLLGAKTASGVVTVISRSPMTQDIVIPEKTIFTAKDGRQYATPGAMTWPRLQNQITIPILAVTPGLTGNAAAGEVNASQFFPDDKFIVTGGVISGGIDAETEAERSARFISFIAALSRGTEDALLYCLTTAQINDPTTGAALQYVTRRGLSATAGFVHLYIWSNIGKPSTDLITRAQAIISGYKNPTTGDRVPGYAAAGIRVEVAAMAEHKVPMTFLIGVMPGYVLDDTMEANIRNSYSALLLTIMAGDTLYPDDVRSAALEVEGVQKAVISMAANITCGPSEVLVAYTGDIVVNNL
ncbi:hypothetical protein fHeYen801_022 [Yersinia phage fHe-Yen8-01]|nr:hypothetical protein fHeYen801_022 [Yersinia phage fHe-Yen8-01]